MALFSGRRKGAFFEGDNKGQLITASFNALSEIQRSLPSNFEVFAKHLKFFVMFLLHLENNLAVHSQTLMGRKNN